MSYVYIESETNVWTVGFYAPDGKWIPESDHALAWKAAERVHWLNGVESGTFEALELLYLWGEALIYSGTTDGATAYPLVKAATALKKARGEE